MTKPTPTVDAPTAPHKEVLRAFFTRDIDGMSFYASFPERATDVTKNFSSIESQGFYLIVSLLSCLPQHQSEPMPTAKESLSGTCYNVKHKLNYKQERCLHPRAKARGFDTEDEDNVFRCNSRAVFIKKRTENQN